MVVQRCAGPLSGLGRALDPASDAEDVAQGADVDLPLWMVQNLAARQMVTLRCCPAVPTRHAPWPACQKVKHACGTWHELYTQ